MPFHVLPYQAWPNLVSCQMAVDGTVTELLCVLGEIGHRVVDLADPQVLTVVESSDRLALGFHDIESYPQLPSLSTLVLRKSY